MLQMSGVFAPATTPFDPVTGDLDVVALRRNARRLLAADLAGVVLFGSTGEGWLLDEDERIAGLEAVASLTEEALILAGAAAESTRATIRLARAAATAGADGVLVAPPSYYRPQMTAEALRDHYRAVADACPVPVLLYQVPPVYSGVELRSGLVAELANHPNIIGIKDSTGNLQGLGELVRSCPTDFAIIVGSGAAFYGALEVGACAGILAVADLAPELCNRVFRCKVDGDDATAGRTQERIGPLHRGVVAAHGVPGVKAALDLLGEVGGPVRPPLKPLREKDRAAVREALATAGLNVSGREEQRDDV
jgi:4-hydroxy-2-oxoglutarate aldolase